MTAPFTQSVYATRKPRDKEYYARISRLPELRQRLVTAEGKTHPAPTAAQARAGNYAKGKLSWQGMTISIENPRGSIRRGGKPGHEWQSPPLPCAYGYILGTVGKDKDHLDIYLGPHLDSEIVFVVDQVNPKTGDFDEHKTMFGYKSAQAAKAACLGCYSSNWRGFMAITPMTIKQFRAWIEHGDMSKPMHKQATERYARLGGQPIQWNDEQERLHPRGRGDKGGQFVSKGQQGGSKPPDQPPPAGSPAPKPKPAPKPTGKASIGGRAFELLKSAAGLFFRISPKGPWSKASPAAAKAIEERSTDELSYHKAAADHEQAHFGDVPEAKRLHDRTRAKARDLVDQILLSMQAQRNAPDATLEAREAAWREQLNRKYMPMVRQTGEAYKQAVTKEQTARKLKEQLGAKIGRTLRRDEEIEDPETGELLQRHVVETRQQIARQAARAAQSRQKQAWKGERKANWQRQLDEWAAKRSQREAERKKRLDERESKRTAAEAKAATHAASPRGQQEAIAAQMKTALTANRRAAVPKAQGAKAMENQAMKAYEAAIASGAISKESLPTATVKEKTPGEIEAAKAEKRKQAAQKAAQTRKEAEDADKAKTEHVNEVARAEGLDPEHLQAAAEELAAREYTTEDQEYNDGIATAVASSGLTPEKVDAMIDAGQDYNDVPNFDHLANAIASDHPHVLGTTMGASHQGDPEALWEALKKGYKPNPDWRDYVDQAAAMAKQGQSEYQEEGGYGDEVGDGELQTTGVGDEGGSFPWEKFRRRGRVERYQRLRVFYARKFKAASGQKGLFDEPIDPEFEKLHPRDESGEFTNKEGMESQIPLKKSSDKLLDDVSADDTIGESGQMSAEKKEEKGQGEKKMETTVEKKWEPKAVPEAPSPMWTVPAGLPGDAAKLAGKNLRVRGVIVKDGKRLADFGEIYVGSKRTNFMARLDNKPQLASEIEKWEKAQREAEQIESENKTGEEDAIRSGRNPIEPVYHDGEYLSGYEVYGVAADLLRDIGAAHDVSGWGTEVDSKLIDKLGKSFTYADAQEFTHPDREAKQKLRDEHEHVKTAKFREAKETGKPVVVAHWMETRRVKEGGEWGEYQFSCTRYAMPDGSTRDDAINTY